MQTRNAVSSSLSRPSSHFSSHRLQQHCMSPGLIRPRCWHHASAHRLNLAQHSIMWPRFKISEWTTLLTRFLFLVFLPVTFSIVAILSSSAVTFDLRPAIPRISPVESYQWAHYNFQRAQWFLWQYIKAKKQKKKSREILIDIVDGSTRKMTLLNPMAMDLAHSKECSCAYRSTPVSRFFDGFRAAFLTMSSWLSRLHLGTPVSDRSARSQCSV